MKKLTAREKEEMRKMIMEYHANNSMRLLRELNEMGSPRGNVIKGWIQIIKGISEILKRR